MRGLVIVATAMPTTRWVALRSGGAVATRRGLAHGGSRKRRRGERSDSVPSSMLDARARHREQLRAVSADPNVALAVKELKLGRRRGFANQKRAAHRGMPNVRGELVESWWSTKKDDMPRAARGAKEFALVGHSNCGKSALLNALTGIDGLARVDARAGWTDAISWYRVVDERDALEEEWEAEEGEPVPGLVDPAPPGEDVNAGCVPASGAGLGVDEDPAAVARHVAFERGVRIIDLPGYGAAVGIDRKQAARWQSASQRLLEDRSTMLRVFLLVDAARGLCDEDRTMVAALERLRRPYSVVLTKVSVLLFTVTFHANLAHSLTRSP